MNISVIIPMYNAAHTIKACVESVLNQTYTDGVEIVVVNDGSTDGSIKVLNDIIRKNQSDVKITILDKKNGGVSSARNAGLQIARGIFVALLDADDRWLPKKLEIQTQLMKKYPEIDFIGCARNEEKLNIFGLKINSLHKVTVTELLIKMYPQTSTALFKYELFKRCGGYDEKMSHAEDGNLWIRYCAESNFYYIPNSLVITGDGKPNFGHSGLSANLSAMENGSRRNLKMALDKGHIKYFFYLILLLFYKLKYIRRIIILRLR